MTTKTESKESVDKTHRKFAVECFNNAWDYLDKASLTPEEEMAMLSLAHASRFHWSKIGNARNFAVGDWQVSRCYTKINDCVSALKFAESCLQITLDNKVENNYVSAYEGIARAYAICKDYTKAKEYIEKAEKEFEKVTDKEDREIFEPQIKDTKSLIK